MGQLVVSDLKIYVDGSFGNFKLEKIKSFDVSNESDAEIITAIGVDGGAGYRFKNGGGELGLEAYVEQGIPQVDWIREKLRKTIFAVTMQYTGGQRFQFTGALVGNVSLKSDDQGSHMQTLKLKYLQMRILPSA